MSNKSTLQSNNTELSSNNLDLQALIDQANALPDVGVELPELTNEGTTADLFSGKELIDGDGNKVTGTFSIDTELSTQDDLITQIQAAVDNLPEANGGSGGTSIETCAVTVNILGGISAQHYCATVFTEENGISLGTNEVTGLFKPTIVENVVCGSGFYLMTGRPILAGHSVAGGALLIKCENSNSHSHWFFSIPQKPTGDVVITVRDDD